MNSKKNPETLLEISDGDLFKDLRFCKLETQLRKKSRSVPKKEKIKSSYSKKYLLENYQSCSLSPRIGPGWLSVRGLNNECQMAVRRSAYVSPGNQRVTWRSGVCLAVYSDIDTGLEGSKSLISQFI